MSVFKVKEKRVTYQRQEKRTSLHCCVPLCANSSRYNSEISFHRFPADPELRAQWLLKVRRDNFSPAASTRVCSRHFKTGDFVVTTGGKRKLNRGVVPCLFAWNNYSVPAPRLNICERRPRCPSPALAAPDSDSEMEIQKAPDHNYSLTPTTSAVAGSLSNENGALRRRIQELEHQLETLQLQSRFGLQRLAGSDEDIRFDKSFRFASYKHFQAFGQLLEPAVKTRMVQITSSCAASANVCEPTQQTATHFVNGAPTDEFPDPLDALDETNIPKSPPEKRLRFDQSETRIETLEMIPTINTELVRENDPQRNLWRDEDTGTHIQHVAVISTSVEDSLRMTAYIQAEEIEHLKKQLSNMQYISVTPELINNSTIANYFEFCTGFTFDMFNALCTFLRVPSDSTAKQIVSPLIYTKETRHTKTVPLRSQFLLVLMKLRNNYDTKDLAFKFQIDVQSVNLILNAWINYLYHRLGQISLWPHRDVISAHMPDNFKREFPTTFAIMDCTELKLERQTLVLLPSQTASDSQTTNTLKGLVVCDPRGSILFVSTLYSGTISDRDLFRQCSITTQLYHLIETGYLNPGDGLMADKGFQNQKDIEEIGLSLNIPLVAQGNEQMPFLDLQKKKKAKYRMHVMKAIAKIKKFKIVSEKIPNSIISNINQIWFVVSMLTNFQPHILGE